MERYFQRAKPCPTCPYVKANPVGVWDSSEYLKLPTYDPDHKPIPSIAVFQCHYSELGLKKKTICQGWLDCHGADTLLAIRLAAMQDLLPKDFSLEPSGAVVYKSGMEACLVGLKAVSHPDDRAQKAIKKLTKRKNAVKPIAKTKVRNG